MSSVPHAAHCRNCYELTTSVDVTTLHSSLEMCLATLVTCLLIYTNMNMQSK